MKKNITNEEINNLPLKSFPGKIVIVTQTSKLAQVFQEVAEHAVTGFDTETRPVFVKGKSYPVALLQIALPEKVFLIRLRYTGLTPEIINYLESTDILKAGVGVRDDIHALQKMNRFRAAGFVDLTTMTREAEIEAESIKKLTALLLGFRISKGAQTSNWDLPVLTPKQVAYAATDAWVCLCIHEVLTSK